MSGRKRGRHERERNKVWAGEDITGQVKHRTKKKKRLIMEGYKTKEATQH